ncbi:VTT domain-containing protein [Microbacterium sp.]|uniref:DedA family protein n=1 Tax=Microbacterium sp. TaxID=51671 RepID=UPI0028116CD3|nr:VTT domain-containing protein [Microbacterium sp.]
MLPDPLLIALTGPWGLIAMGLLVLCDAFLVVVPGEIAVTALGALAVSEGAPPLWAVISVAAIAAWSGDATCFLIGRRVGLQRWRWMRTAKVQAALTAARRRLDRNAATVLFTARFVPFARLAVNLTAGASRLHPVRFLSLAACAAAGWAAYQAAVGAAIAAILPGGPLVAVVVSVVVAIAIGVIIDRVVTRTQRRDTTGRPFR